MEGYRWFGRNRTRRKEGTKPSGGVGLLVCERLLRGATVRERIPTYGKCEGLLVVEIEKNGKTLSLIVAWSPRSENTPLG